MPKSYAVREAVYDEIADWYDDHVRSTSLIDDLLLPDLFDLLGNIQTLRICDLACGQGHLARKLARRGAKVVGVDLSVKLLALAGGYETQNPVGVTYILDNAETLSSLAGETFDGVVCHLALMDIENLSATFQVIWRILRPAGWFAFSITHPCFQAPHAAWITQPDGSASREISHYFEEGFWRSRAPQGVRGQVGAYHRRLSTYFNTLAQTGFRLEKMIEPRAPGRVATRIPGYATVPAFLLVRCKKV